MSGEKLGIRISKTLGYGLSDVKTDKDGLITDSRFRPEFIDDIHELSGFEKWLKKNKSDATIMLASLLGINPHQAKMAVMILTNGFYGKDALNTNVIKYDSEFGLSNVMLLTPPESKDWQRYDDIIDYIEADDAEPQYVDLFKDNFRCGIYPHDTMILIPGRKNLIPKNKGTLSGGDYNMMTGRYDKKLKATVRKDILQHLKEDWTPKIPESLLLFSLYAKMFVRPLDVFQLRPMIYIYWS